MQNWRSFKGRKRRRKKYFFTSCFQRRKFWNSKILSWAGADIEVRDDDGNTPLIYASIYGHIEIVKYLIDQGADIEIRNNYGRSFTFYLAKDQKEKVEKIIEDLQKRRAMIKSCRSN